jgi:hypothetical protein
MIIFRKISIDLMLVVIADPGLVHGSLSSCKQSSFISHALEWLYCLRFFVAGVFMKLIAMMITRRDFALPRNRTFNRQKIRAGRE